MADKHVAPGRGVTWRPRTKRERVRTCSAVGLSLGDCMEQRLPESAYCYYHDKLRTGAISSVMRPSPGTSRWGSVPPSVVYPVWPLPPQGYVLITEEIAAA